MTGPRDLIQRAESARIHRMQAAHLSSANASPAPAPLPMRGSGKHDPKRDACFNPSNPVPRVLPSVRIQNNPAADTSRFQKSSTENETIRHAPSSPASREIHSGSEIESVPSEGCRTAPHSRENMRPSGSRGLYRELMRSHDRMGTQHLKPQG